MCAGQTVVAINGQFLDNTSPQPELLALMRAPARGNTPPVHLTILKKSSEYCTLVPTSGGLGFHIKGSSPVVIHGVEKGRCVRVTAACL